MKIKDIYNAAVETGIKFDPRGVKEVSEELKQARKEYEALKEEDKKWFDKERLTNPYSDTRVLYGDPEREVKRILVGIDMEVGEIVLADRLRETGRPIDLIIAHHPEGKAMAALYDVMGMQSGILAKHGVPIHIAEDLMADRISEVQRRLLPANHTRAVDAARLLDIPIMCIHTPTDNAVATFLQDMFDDKDPRYLSDIIDEIRKMPEYESAMHVNAGPKVVVGTEKRRAGKIFVDMTGGTGGSSKIFSGLSSAGIDTVLGMHISEEHRKEAAKQHVNVVIAGHISSDNLGINLLFDEILEDGVEIVECSGFRRFTRK